MALLFLTQTFQISIYILVTVSLFTFILFKPKKVDREILFSQILIFSIISYIAIVLGVWVWLFFFKPNIVSLTWFFLTIILVLSLAASLSDFSDINESSIMVILVFTIVMLITKLLIILGIIFFVVMTVSEEDDRIRYPQIPKAITSVFGVLIFIILGSLFVYTPVDNARYFDDILIYDDGLPFNSKVDGTFLRVVDYELAESIMKKSNSIGSNTHITDIHLGKINGSTYWIGAISFSGNKFIRSDLNYYQAFIAVDFRDPSIEPIVVKEEFYVGEDLAMNNKLSRVLYNYNRNYRIGDNQYFTQADDGKMRLMVPYAIQSGVFLSTKGAGFVTQEIQKLGGVLELDASGEILEDYRDLTKLPEYGQVQYYSEIWLEREIRYWGKSIIDDHEFGVLTRWGGIFKSAKLTGIDDDIRVLIDPSTHSDVQFVLLDSTGSDNQILRGAMKANASGIYYYDWSNYVYIDTNTAHEHGETALTNYFGNSFHGYKTLLPILYPLIDNPRSLEDYAYVMPLLFTDVRFGGVLITDPSDKSGAHSVVKIADPDAGVNISQIVSDAITDYLDTSNISDAVQAEFEISKINNYISGGNTIYVMDGNLTIHGNTSLEVIIFKQELIIELKEWLIVVNANIGDILKLTFIEEDDILMAISVEA